MFKLKASLGKRGVKMHGWFCMKMESKTLLFVRGIKANRENDLVSFFLQFLERRKSRTISKIVVPPCRPQSRFLPTMRCHRPVFFCCPPNNDHIYMYISVCLTGTCWIMQWGRRRCRICVVSVLEYNGNVAFCVTREFFSQCKWWQRNWRQWAKIRWWLLLSLILIRVMRKFAKSNLSVLFQFVVIFLKHQGQIEHLELYPIET